MARVKILVVDDEPFILRSLEYVMRKEGHDVAGAADGEEALEKIRSFRPALVFLDVMMPKKDGFEVCRAVKQDPQLAETYVIMLTAKGQTKDRTLAIAAGADEYVTKPFRPSLVVEKVRALAASRFSNVSES